MRNPAVYLLRDLQSVYARGRGLAAMQNVSSAVGGMGAVIAERAQASVRDLSAAADVPIHHRDTGCADEDGEITAVWDLVTCGYCLMAKVKPAPAAPTAIPEAKP